MRQLTPSQLLRGISYLDRELSLGEVRLVLLCLLQNSRGVLLGQTAADRAGLLGPEVKGQVLLVLVEEAELSPLLGVDDGQDTGNRLAEVVAVQGMLAICIRLIIRTSIFHHGRERI